MGPEQIVALVSALVQLSPLIPMIVDWGTDQIAADEGLSDAQKTELIGRIRSAQASVPEWM